MPRRRSGGGKALQKKKGVYVAIKSSRERDRGHEKSVMWTESEKKRFRTKEDIFLKIKSSEVQKRKRRGINAAAGPKRRSEAGICHTGFKSFN